MLNIAFLGFFLLAVSKTTLQSPVQDGPGEVYEVRRSAVKSPITALTTSQSPYYDRQQFAERDVYTTLDHPAPTRRHTTPTSTSTPTTSASTAIPTKSLKNCNVEGIPSNYLVQNILDMRYAYDALACQLRCMYISRCEAYSWQMPVSTDSNNCVFYSTLIDGERKVTPSNISGIFFSDKYPSDKTNFCYGSEIL
ncbi:uncharacterized protein PAC_09073 [Phialocephala subalpina]|uniref:Apple domain-containing protein n=1 Tax=Phialocephala subalpina TaxID=576137 RepID=A0A1L7X2C5_9HELO|nr:uncharacterized protein PAC_09073 [Phialocephala subalpina]